MTNSKLNTKFCSSVINPCHSLFVWSSKMAKISLVEVVLHCIIIFPTTCLYPDNEDNHENAEVETLFKVGQFKNAIRFKMLNHICLNWA